MVITGTKFCEGLSSDDDWMAFLFDKKLCIELASEIPFPIVILMMEMLRIVGFSIYIYILTIITYL